MAVTTKMMLWLRSTLSPTYLFHVFIIQLLTHIQLGIKHVHQSAVMWAENFHDNWFL